MKANNIFILISAAVAVSACVKDVEQIEQIGQQVTISASQEGSAGTKTTVQNDGTKVYWEPGDAISVFYNGTGSKFISHNTELASIAQFSGTFYGLVGSTEGSVFTENIWGLYPYREDASSDGHSVSTVLPSSQTARAGSFSQKTHITLACSHGLNLAFYNVTGGVRFSLTNQGIKKVAFEGLNGESLAGSIKIAFSDGVPVVSEISEGEKCVTLYAPDNGTFETGIWYYLSLLPGELKTGFKLIFFTDTGAGQRRFEKTVTIKRGIFGNLPNVDEGVTFKSEPDAIDLGLSVKWASCNVGAIDPEDIGGRYAWGELDSKSFFDWDNYKWCNGTYNSLTKYCTNAEYGTVDGKTRLDDEDDVALVTYGGKWRMPDTFELNELWELCTWTKTNVGTVSGYTVTGPNGNSIFIPNCGQADEGGLHLTDDVFIWSAETGQIYSHYGTLLSTYFGSVTQGLHKHDGICVRAVYGDKSAHDDKHYTNLSETETSNCYIVSKPGYYCFNAGVKGNGNDLLATTPYSAEVLWESFGTDVKPQVGDVVSDVHLNGQYVYFKSGKDGNAVIAVNDAGGDILWSWHIWVCDGFNPEQTQQAYTNNVGIMMDRNLGATKATPNTAEAMGLMYQWGRKDPFMNGANYYSSNLASSTISSWPYYSIDQSILQDNTTLNYSIANPTTYITNGSAPLDWYCMDSQYQNDDLWGHNGDKTVYDPCPAGWRVPPGGPNGIWSDFSSSTVSPEQYGIICPQGICGDTAWYPLSGNRDEYSGNIHFQGSMAWYWSATPVNNYYVYLLLLTSSGAINNQVSDGHRVSGHAIRCCKDKVNVPQYTDLGSKETANCYMINTPGRYGFNATVIGNGDAGIISDAGFHTSSSTIHPSKVIKIWEDTENVVSDLSLDNGVISFSASDIKGNALIAALDDNDSILWSWHIWRTDDINTHTNPNGYVVMDRNLGATSASESETEASYGLFYQWGRKDPLTRHVFPLLKNTPQSIEYSIQHPDTYIYSDIDGIYDWLSEENDNLWGNPTGYNKVDDKYPLGQKTIYDPCPPGYQVPPYDVWDGISTENAIENNTVTGRTYDGIWYPYAGCIYFMSISSYSYINALGYYWTNSPTSEDSRKSIDLDLGANFWYVNPYFQNARAHAFSVRCILKD